LEQTIKADRGVEVKLYSFFNLGRNGCMCWTPRSGRFIPGNSRYPLYRGLGGPQGRSGRVRKSRPHLDSIPGPSSP